MKVNIEIDMTPEEARQMMGLPDVRKLQEKIAAEMQKRMMAALDGNDPQALLKAWKPGGFEPLEKLWEAAGQRRRGNSGKSSR